jgi:hypothetical protein
MIGFGVALGYSADGVTYTDVAKVVDITPPEPSVGKSKSTHNATANATHTYEPTLIEPGENDVKILFAKAVHAVLDGFFWSRATKFWKITLAEGSTQTFQGFIMNLGTPTPMEDQVQTTMKMCVTGKVTFTAGT